MHRDNSDEKPQCTVCHKSITCCRKNKFPENVTLFDHYYSSKPKNIFQDDHGFPFPPFSNLFTNIDKKEVAFYDIIFPLRFSSFSSSASETGRKQ